jgi:hypothetical protein
MRVEGGRHPGDRSAQPGEWAARPGRGEQAQVAPYQWLQFLSMPPKSRAVHQWFDDYKPQICRPSSRTPVTRDNSLATGYSSLPKLFWALGARCNNGRSKP